MAAVSRSTVNDHFSSHHEHVHQQRHAQTGRPGTSGGVSRIPDWFEVASFQYNTRIAIGFMPGIVLLGAVLGKTFFAVLLFCFMIILLLRSVGYHMPMLVATISTVLICQITNFYLMLPLMWHSIINLPMFMILHLLIALAGTWGMLLNQDFLKQDPRLILIVEKGLFIILPAIDLVMVGWVSGMLWGKEYLPLVLAITGICLSSLFYVPLKSSFVRQGTPQYTGLILPQPVALCYIMLCLFLPGIINAALNSTDMFYSVRVFLKYQIYFAAPAFVLSLLEAQGIFYWFGSGFNVKIIRLLRILTGSILMGLLSYMAHKTPSSTSLPTFGVMILFGILALTITLDNEHTHLPLPSLILSGVVCVLYFVSSFAITWSTNYTFSLLSVPYFLVQLLLVMLALSSVGLLVAWRKDLTFLWPTYHASCELILHNEALYSLPLLVSTASAAVLLCLRLNRVGRLPLPLTLMCVIVHIVKLFQVLPHSLTMPFTTSYLSVLSMIGCGLIGIGLLKLASSNQHSPIVFLLSCVSCIIGFSMCVNNVVSPLLAAITHSPPSGADLACAVLLLSGYLVQQYLGTVSQSRHYTALSKLPPSFFIMAMLVWILRLDFDLYEITKAVAIIAVHHADVNSFIGRIVTSDQISLMAWLVMVKWFVVAYAGLSLATVILSEIVTIVPFFSAVWLLGSSAGMLAIIILGHHTPLSFLGLLYILYASNMVLLVSVIAYSHMIQRRQFAVVSLFLVVLGVMIVLLPWEWSMPLNNDPDVLHIPSAFFIMLGFVLFAITAKLKSLTSRGVPVHPVFSNISCLLAFILAVSFPLPFKIDQTLVISLSSCVMMFAQPDGYVIPKRQGLFLAPTLLMSSTGLFCVIIKHIFSATLSTWNVLQLICLFASVPGQYKLISSLWWDVPMRFSLWLLVLVITPNALLAQFGGNSNMVYGSTAILCFSLLTMAEFQTLKTI